MNIQDTVLRYFEKHGNVLVVPEAAQEMDYTGLQVRDAIRRLRGREELEIDNIARNTFRL